MAFFTPFSMAFSTALAKYALGYGSLLGSYVRAALHNARNPSPSRSGISTDFCHGGLVCTKNRANILARGTYSATRACRFLESFNLGVM